MIDMFFRMKNLKSGRNQHQYLHLAENTWDQGKVRQRMVASLGRIDELVASGTLERMATQLVGMCPGLRLEKEQAAPLYPLGEGQNLGAPLALGKLWNELGLKKTLSEMTSVSSSPASERAIFGLVLQRLADPESLLAPGTWIKNVHGEGLDAVKDKDFDQAMRLLADSKDQIEQRLQGLRSGDAGRQGLVCLDMILGRDRERWLLAVLVDGEGLPGGIDLWPANRLHAPELIQAISRWKERSGVEDILVAGTERVTRLIQWGAVKKAGFEHLSFDPVSTGTYSQKDLLPILDKSRWTKLPDGDEYLLFKADGMPLGALIDPQELAEARAVGNSFVAQVLAATPREIRALRKHPRYGHLLAPEKNACQS